ncbi:unnamed protein product, partial [Rotaria sp. Silwood2]
MLIVEVIEQVVSLCTQK